MPSSKSNYNLIHMGTISRDILGKLLQRRTAYTWECPLCSDVDCDNITFPYGARRHEDNLAHFILRDISHISNTVYLVDTQVQDKNLTPDRQGYLGKLKDRTIAELIELLERQEKILSKRKFLESLPDKGEKTKAFAVFLKHLVEERSRGIPSSTVLTDCDMDQISDLHQRTISVKNNSHSFSEKDHSETSAQNEINKQSQTTEISQKGSPNSNEKSIVDLSSNLALGLEKMSLGGSIQSPRADTEHYINSYERVIKQAEVRSTHKKQKFLPNRAMKAFWDQVDSATEQAVSGETDSVERTWTLLHFDIPPSPYPHGTAHKWPEREQESAANPPCYKYKSQLIPVEESVKLIEQQRALNEEHTTQRAARKLADQLLPKMNTYAPASTDMQYRETADTDQDSDDEDDNDEDSDSDVD